MAKKKRQSAIKQVRLSGSLPPMVKAARREEQPESTSGMRPAWVFTAMDENGPWGKPVLTPDFIWNDILPKMRNFESMTWGQIEQDMQIIRWQLIRYAKPQRGVQKKFG